MRLRASGCGRSATTVARAPDRRCRASGGSIASHCRRATAARSARTSVRDPAGATSTPRTAAASGGRSTGIRRNPDCWPCGRARAVRRTRRSRRRSMASWRFCARSMSRSSRHRWQRKSPSRRLRYAQRRQPPSAANAARLLRHDAARRSRHLWQAWANVPSFLTAAGLWHRLSEHSGAGVWRRMAGGTKPSGSLPLHWATRVGRSMSVSCSGVAPRSASVAERAARARSASTRDTLAHETDDRTRRFGPRAGRRDPRATRRARGATLRCDLSEGSPFGNALARTAPRIRERSANPVRPPWTYRCRLLGRDVMIDVDAFNVREAAELAAGHWGVDRDDVDVEGQRRRWLRWVGISTHDATDHVAMDRNWWLWSKLSIALALGVAIAWPIGKGIGGSGAGAP